MTTGNQHDNQPKPATVKEMHEQIQKNMTDARKTPEYAEEKASEPKPATGKQCTCGNLGPEQGIPSPMCPIHGNAWDKPATGEWTREMSKELANKITRDAMLRQGDPVTTIHNAINAALESAKRESAKEIAAVTASAITQLDQAYAKGAAAGWNEGREHERKCNEAALAKLRDALVKAQHRFDKSGWPEAAKEIEDALR